MPLDIHEAYADALTDLAQLLEEIRFSGALACLYIEDYTLTSHAPDEETGEAKRLRDLGMPVEVIAALSAYVTPPPYPIILLETPHTKLAGDRVLSLWFAGQILDAALVRTVAALDRLATLLWCAAGRSLRDARGRSRFPAFRRGDLTQLKGAFRDTEWGALYALTDHVLFNFLLGDRNDFTHSRRRLSELHGAYRVAYGTQGDPAEVRIQQAIDKDTHLAILLAAYNEILRPAVSGCRNCLQPDGAPST